MILGAGVDPRTEEIRPAEITDRQAMELGLPPEPLLLGCGTMACAYAGERDGEVIKITHDVRDARMSYIVSENPQPWAVRIRAVFRLPDGLYAIVADYAEPLHTADPPLAAAFDALWDEIAKQKLEYAGWPNFREISELNVEDDVAEMGETDQLKARMRALALADEAVKGFGRLGMGWLDFHGGNWGMAGGRSVVIDLGLSQPLDEPPVRALERRAGMRMPWLGR